MKITKITVKNYRSIQEIALSPSNFNVIVGQNNHGKTNLFDSIEWFYNAKSSDPSCHFKKDPSNEISVELEYQGAQKAAERIPTEIHKTKILNLFDGADEFSIRKTSADHKRMYIIGGKEKKSPSGIDTAINEFLPKLEYVKTKIKLDDYIKYGKSPMGSMLSGVLSEIISKSPEYEKFEKEFAKVFGEDEQSTVRAEINKLSEKVEVYLEKQFPDGAKVTFQINPPQLEDLLKNFNSEIDDGIVTDAADKGDGMQRALMLAVIQAYADFRRENDSARDFLFLIDEAELHLHPSGQRALKTALLDIASDGDQVVLNTHSSVLVADNHAQQAVFTAKKNAGVTNLASLGDKDKPGVVFDLLGGSPTDLLLPKNIIIVEGYSEVFFLRAVISRFYEEQYSGLQIVPANGDVTKQSKSIRLVNSAYECFKSDVNPYSGKILVIADAPNDSNQDQYDEFRNAHPELVDSGRFFELPEQSLEEYYPDTHKADPNSIAGQQGGKNEYAENVAKALTQEQFENGMSTLKAALDKASQLSFGN